MTGTRWRLLIADDHPIFRAGVARVLEENGVAEVIGQVGTVDDTILAYRTLLPDVVLLDLHMPDGDGIVALRALVAADPPAKVIVLSAASSSAQIERAMRHGALGFLSKEVGPEALAECIGVVAEGRMFGRELSALPVAPRAARPPSALTAREIEVLSAIAEGMTNKAIGAQMQIVEGTVKQHVSHIMRKLRASSRAEAIAIALQDGILARQRVASKPSGGSGRTVIHARSRSGIK